MWKGLNLRECLCLPKICTVLGECKKGLKCKKHWDLFRSLLSKLVFSIIFFICMRDIFCLSVMFFNKIVKDCYCCLIEFHNKMVLGAFDHSPEKPRSHYPATSRPEEIKLPVFHRGSNWTLMYINLLWSSSTPGTILALTRLLNGGSFTFWWSV